MQSVASATPDRRWIWYALIALFVAARLWHIAAFCIDGDEIFSESVSRQGWQDITDAAAHDSVHPPLFYYLLHLWMNLGTKLGVGNDTLLWLRLVPATFSILSIIPLLLLARELRLRAIETQLAIGLAALHPLLLYYSQHVRMYSMLACLGLLSFWECVRLLRRPVDAPARFGFTLLTLTNIVMVYAHYYGWVVIGTEGLLFLIWRRRSLLRMIASGVVTLVAFWPWLLVAYRSAVAKGGLAVNLDWIGRPELKNLGWFLIDLTGCGELPVYTLWATVGVFAAIGIALWTQRGKLRTTSVGQTVLLLLAWTFVPVLFAYTVSQYLPQSVWGHRHLLFVIVPFLMLCVMTCARVPSRRFLTFAAIVYGLWIVQAAAHHIHGDDRKVPWDRLVLQMLAQEQGTATPVKIYAVDRWLHYPIWFYLDALKLGRRTGFAERVTDDQMRTLPQRAALLEVAKADKIEDAHGDHFWVGYTHPNHERKHPMQDYEVAHGCRVGEALHVGDRFHSVTMFPVWCSVR